MPRILVTNDDGVHAEGIRLLAEAVAPYGEITVVAPIQEASAIGHALTLRRPLRIEAISERVFAIDGTPTDCVNVAITHILREKPDLIVSGINKGWNLGDDVTYSGTVSGALEGALLGIPSIAFSAQRVKDEADYEPAAKAAAVITAAVLERGMPKFTLVNVNTPWGPNKGFRVTRLSAAELDDVTELRALVEIPTIRRLAEQGFDPADLARLRPLAAEIEDAARRRDFVAHVATDLEFHLALLDLAGNPRITELVRSLRMHARLYGLRDETHRDELPRGL